MHAFLFYPVIDDEFPRSCQSCGTSGLLPLGYPIGPDFIEGSELGLWPMRPVLLGLSHFLITSARIGSGQGGVLNLPGRHLCCFPFRFSSNVQRIMLIFPGGFIDLSFTRKPP